MLVSSKKYFVLKSFICFELILSFAACGSDNVNIQSPETEIVNSANEQEGGRDITKTKYLYTDPSFVWHPATVERTYYRYMTENTDWINTETDFPYPAFIQLAKQEAMLHHQNKTDKDYKFIRGCLFDIDQDGLQESVVLLTNPLNAKQPFTEETSDFVFVDSSGEAKYLTIGANDSSEDISRMDVKLLKYSDFQHIVVYSGNSTAAGGGRFIIYSPFKDGIKEELYESYLQLCDKETEESPGLIPFRSNAFLVAFGPQGMGPRYLFWNDEKQEYSDVGLSEMPVEDFLKIFDPNNMTWSEQEQSWISAHSVWPWDYSKETIESVRQSGGRFFIPRFKDQEKMEYDGHVTYYLNLDGTWRVSHVGAFMEDLRIDEENAVGGVDMLLAAKTAIS